MTLCFAFARPNFSANLRAFPRASGLDQARFAANEQRQRRVARIAHCATVCGAVSARQTVELWEQRKNSFERRRRGTGFSARKLDAKIACESGVAMRVPETWQSEHRISQLGIASSLSIKEDSKAAGQPL
jgi:hypothetical protein